jgi:hypothetical protein
MQQGFHKYIAECFTQTDLDVFLHGVTAEEANNTVDCATIVLQHCNKTGTTM